jgi:L-lactate dehydrogenase (cytochrome)
VSIPRRIASTEDFRIAARRRLPRVLFEYIDGGSYDEITLRRNVEDLQKISLKQRVMRDMSQLDLTTHALGQSFALPIGLSPVGMAGMFGRRGETQAAKAAARAGIPFCLSTMAVCSIEEVARTGIAPWFQLYVLKDRGYIRELLSRARIAGCPALVLTVDLAIPGARYRDIRSGFRGLTGPAKWWNQFQDGIKHPTWAYDVWLAGRPHSLGCVSAAVGGSGSLADYFTWIANNFDRSITWTDLEWIRAQWSGPLVIKGILEPEDARQAADLGVEAIVVSNHGGRQLDGVKSTITALPPILDRVGNDLTVFMDGGIRSGLDVLKALSLGAKACFLGRPWAYALAVGGEAAITKLLDTMRAELEVAMTLTGCRTLAAAGRELLG